MAEFTNVSIVLPAINETASFQKTVDVIMDTCDKKDLAELFIVLCAKTTPETVAVAERIKESGLGIPVTVYFQQKPFIGGAMQEAFERVVGSHVVMMSTDLETPPELIKQFIQLEKENPTGIVTASRWIRGGGFSGYSRVKVACNWLFQTGIGLLFGCKNTDLTYAYRIFPTELMQSIRWEEQKHPFFLETALKPLRLGVTLTEIPAHWTARTEGESQNSFFQNFAYFKTAFRIRLMKRADILRRDEGVQPAFPA